MNDNRPIFSQNEYRTSLTENAPVGTTVAIVSATDGDTGNNGEITYTLGASSSEAVITGVCTLSRTLTSPGLFSINSTTGVVTVTGNVNFEMGQEHQLSVEARDHGNPQRSNVVILNIQVINAEDESPRFPISFYTASVNEGNAIAHTFDWLVTQCAWCRCPQLNLGADSDSH